MCEDCDHVKWETHVVARTGLLVCCMPRSLLLQRWWDLSGDWNTLLNRSCASCQHFSLAYMYSLHFVVVSKTPMQSFCY